MTDPIGPVRAALAGRYEIERKIGEGAFAAVYLAQDLRHDRLVAIKVLSADPTSDNSELRFLAEIRLLAKLQHPNIVPLIDSGHAGATLYYVMPYVNGESLRERIDRERQLPLDSAVAIAREAADALAYAHEQGIIHRDIKPENVLLSAGHAMIADFGVARAIDLAGVRQLTRPGVAMLGTPAYMSPEQLLGDRQVDQRTDIYSLGCVLYEMLTGKPPFAGKEGFAKRFTGPPPLPSAMRHDLPGAMDAIVAKSLAPDPKDRYPTAAEFARDLTEGVNKHPSTPSPAVAPGKEKGGNQRRLFYAVIALAILMSGTAIWGWMRPAPSEPVVRYTLVVDSTEAMVQGSASSGRVDISPDGLRLAYIGGATGQLLIRPRDQLRAIAVPGTEGATTPFFSPDGQQVGFVSGKTLQIVSLNGGAPVIVTDSLVEVSGASWGRDGFIYADGLGNGGLVRVEAKAGAVPKPFSVLDTARGEIDHRWPDVLPNGKGVVFTVMFSRKNSITGKPPFAIAVADIPSGKHRVIVDDATYARYAASGDLLYVTTKRVLMVVPFDQKSMKITGEPTALTEDMRRLGRLGSPDLAISDEGTLVYATSAGEGEQELVWVTRDGKGQPVDPDWQGGSFSDPSISPDGKRLAVARGTGGETGDIWIKQLDQGPSSKLTEDGSNNASPTWTPDGRSVTFSSDAAGSFDLWTKRADGSAQAVPQFHEKKGNSFGSRWSHDGKWLIFQTSEWSSPGSGDIVGIRLGLDTVPVPLVATTFRETSPALSPNGHWLAYTSNESGDYDVYVVPFPGTAAAKWVVSTHGGTQPQWSHSGRELFYRDAAGNLVAVDVKTTPTFSTGHSATLFPATGFASFPFRPQYDVSGDDKHFLMIRPLPASGPDQLIVVENWFEELKAKLRN